jgi:hypothetical protein
VTSIPASPPPRVYTVDPSKIKTLDDAKPVSYGPVPVWTDAEQEDGPPAGLIPNNGEENVWGRISLPNGEVATIYNGGGVETESMMLDIDWSLQTEEERSNAILARYGGVLKIKEPPEKPPEIGSDVAGFWSSVMGNPALADRMLGAADHRLVPDDLFLDDPLSQAGISA